jgi:hypothetical protein
MLKNVTTYQKIGEEKGIAYGNLTIEDLINRDTDGDGVPDWEEGLYGLDPTKSETTPGIPDSVALATLKTEWGSGEYATSRFTEDEENLTETDKFSRELFATIASLSQGEDIDQITIDALGVALAEQIKNSTPQKIYALTDIKIAKEEGAPAMQKYSEALTAIYEKHSTAQGVAEVLEKLVADEDNMSVLRELDPMIAQIGKIVNELLKLEAPRSVSLLHLDLINVSQRLMENISGMKLMENDPILAIGAVGQYWENSLALEFIAGRLVETISRN